MSKVIEIRESVTPTPIRRRNRNSVTKNIDSWNNLKSILGSLGVKAMDNLLSLNWDLPEDDQFDLLMKLMTQLTNTNLSGTYSDITKEWIVGL